MKKQLLVGLITLLVAGLTFGQAFAQSDNAGGNSNPHNKIRICHATDSHSNPYTNPEVDQDAVDGDLGNDNGQGDHYMEHNGPVWYEGIEDHSWGDIIPPIAGVHNGKNWTAEGQAFWNNNCNLPVAASPSPEATPSATPSPSDNPGTGGTGGGDPVRHGVSFHNSDLKCEDKEFQAKFDVYNYGSPVSGLKVKFTFVGITKEATTNSEGRAEVSFPLTDGVLVAEAEGWGTYTYELKKPVECKDVHIDPQVLGASTLADTGSSSLLVAEAVITAGALLTMAGAYGLRRA